MNEKLVVRDFGSISSADLELKPFTVFIGTNGGGKSYTAMLIDLIHSSISESVLQAILNRRSARFDDIKEDVKSIVEDKIRRNILKYYGLTNLNEIIRTGAKSSTVSMEVPDLFSLGFTIKDDGDLTLHKFEMVEDFPVKMITKKVPIVHYIPSTRVMLTKLSVTAIGVNIKTSVSVDPITYKFVFSLMTPLNVRDDSIANIAEKLEGLIQGKIELKTSPPFSITYTQQGKTLSIEQASSSVTSLTPLIIYLRYNVKKNDIMVIEEPEIHLYPGLMEGLAKVLSTTVNRGVNLIISTYSDMLLSAINILFQAKSASDEIRKELGIMDEEVLDKDKAVAYSFKGGAVEKVEITDEGITLDEFNEVNEDLLRKHAKLFISCGSEEN